MDNKTKYAFAIALGAVSLMALSAVAQQGNQPAQPPAVSAPAGSTGQAVAPADTASKNAGTAQSGDKAGSGANTADKNTADKDTADNRRERYHRRWSRHGGGDGHHWRGHRGWRGDWRGEGRRGQRWRNMSEEDRKAFFEARIASVRAGLMLNETQARLWPNVETALREMVAKRREWAERIRKEGRPANPFDRMKRRGDMMADRGAALQKFANAAKPLYDTLTDDQKRRLRMLTRGFGQRGGMIRGRGMHRGHHGMRGQRWQRQGHYRQNWRNRHAEGGNFGQGRRWRQSYSEDTGLAGTPHGWQNL
jgi:hypothetical protein